MIENNRKLLRLINAVIDVLLGIGSFYLTVLLFFNIAYPQSTAYFINAYFSDLGRVLSFVIYSVLLVLALAAAGVYQRDSKQETGRNTGVIFGINLIGMFVFGATLYAFRLVDFSRPVLIVFYVLSSLLIITRMHINAEILERYYLSGRGRKHVILVGNGQLAHEYAQTLEEHPEYGYVLDGYLSMTEREGLGKNYGRFEDLERVLDEHDFDEVVIALEAHESDHLQHVIAAGDKAGVRLSIIPFYSEYLPTQMTVDTIGSSKLINVRHIPLDDMGNAAIKRTIDIIISGLTLLLLCWLYAILAIGVKLSSPGPIIFKQERVGKDKKPFYMYKFRSMRVTDVEDTAWTTNEDPRKTKFGSFIRKYSLDEFPQFFNVFKGDMSIVGPRPEIPFHVDHFKDEVPLYMVRHQVRPGITGWAQINGFRGDTSIPERVRYDVWYVENWSLALDVKIFFRTIFGGFKNDEVVK